MGINAWTPVETVNGIATDFAFTVDAEQGTVPLFADGFETGNTSFWSVVVP